MKFEQILFDNILDQAKWLQDCSRELSIFHTKCLGISSGSIIVEIESESLDDFHDVQHEVEDHGLHIDSIDETYEAIEVLVDGGNYLIFFEAASLNWFLIIQKMF